MNEYCMEYLYCMECLYCLRPDTHKRYWCVHKCRYVRSMSFCTHWTRGPSPTCASDVTNSEDGPTRVPDFEGDEC